MRKRILSLTVVLSMVLAMIPAFSLTASAAVGNLKGSGTEDDPYRIVNALDMLKLRMYIDSGNNCYGEYVKLVKDIDFNDGTWPAGIRVKPIGDLYCNFNGTLEGDGHTISGINFDNEGRFQGLFAVTGASSTIKNLTVSGSINGYAPSSEYTRKIIYSGGITGYNCGAILNCRSDCYIFSDEVGGIAGRNDGIIKNCYNTGTLGGTDYVGGIAGYNNGAGSIENCYNVGAVNSGWRGGIVGKRNCYNIFNSYYLDTCGGAVEGGTPKTAEEFKSGEVTWLLQNGQDAQAWGQKLGDGGDDYPVLTSDESNKVLKVTFATRDNANYDIQYTNLNGTVTPPANPEKENYTFERWSLTQDASGETFDAEKPIAEDMTVYAVGRVSFGGESGEIPVNLTYGEGTTLDLSEYMAYANESDTKDKFTYTIESGGSASCVIDGDTLIIPKELAAGEYTLTIKAAEKAPEYALMSVEDYGTEDVTLTVKVSIAKAASEAAVTSKVLSYTGSAQELVTGTVTGGTLVYSMSEDGNYSETVPTGTDAGTYTVWYKVLGDGNHNDTEPQSVTVTIVRGAIEASVLGKSLTYTGEEQELVEGTVTGGTLVYSMSKDGEYTSNIPTKVNAGSYTVWYKVIADDNHTDTEPQSVTAAIAKIYPETTVIGKDLSYVGSEQELVTGTVKGGTLLYSMSRDGEYAANIPTAVNAGTYTVWYKVTGDANYKDTEPRSIDVTIKKSAPTAAVTGRVLSYTGSAQELVTGVAVGGTLVYSMSEDGNYTENIPTVEDAGNYTVWYKVIGDSNHTDTEPKSVEVTITKTEPTASVTSRVLSYTGSEQELVSGTTTGGTLVYSMSEDGDYSETIPTGTDAGSYTVWYKIIGDINHNDTEPRSIDVTIEKAAAEASVNANELVFKNREQYLVTGKTSDGTLLYSMSENGDYSEKIPTGKDAGDYTVWYKVIGDDNHTDSAPQSITVSIKELVGISIEHEPTNTTIIEGMPFDASGLVVIADCGDGDTFEARGYTLSGYDTSKPGEQTVTVTYAGKTAEFKITVEAKSLTSIELTHTPDKLTYYKGDKLDIAGMVITAIYNNNTSAFIDNDDCTISGSTNNIGAQTVTVTYSGQTAEFTIAVLERPVQTQTVETPLMETAEFYGGKRVIISCATEGADIYYTTDGTNPTTASNKYAAPIELTESAEIKAVAVKSGMTNSAVTNKEVTVEKVAAPAASVTGEVEVGTSVTLLSTTPEAEIYYTFGDSLEEDNYKKYTGEIVITGSMKIRAIAAKRGYAMSDAVTFEYTVAPPEETSETNRALLDAGETMCKEENICYLPAYVYSERAMTDFRYTLSFDSDKFEYVGFEAGEDVPASAVSVTANENSVTVRGTVDGLTAAEVCVLVFRAKSGVEIDDYLLPVSDIEINAADDSLTDIWYLDGLISVIPADTSITASAFLSDAEDNLIEYAEDVKGNLTAYILAQTAEEMPEDGETIGCDLILAFYDVNGALVKVASTEAELSEEMDFFEVPITIPENAEIGEVKLMAWDKIGTMKPLMEAAPVVYPYGYELGE